MVSWKRTARAFTLIELVVVLLLIGALLAFAVIRSDAYSYWREEGFIRRLSETLIFLHHQAVVDQAFYRVEFDFDVQAYRIGVMRAEYGEDDTDSGIENPCNNPTSSTLVCELAHFLNPSLGNSQTLIPPPSFPSLADPVAFPPEVTLVDIRTMRGKVSSNADGRPYVDFSPRGFSEFAVLHLERSNGQPMTILINPFTGNTDIYEGYKDFQWTYSGSDGNN